MPKSSRQVFTQSFYAIDQLDQTFALGYSFTGLSDQQISDRIQEQLLFPIQLVSDEMFRQEFVQRLQMISEPGSAADKTEIFLPLADKSAQPLSGPSSPGEFLQFYITTFNAQQFDKFWSAFDDDLKQAIHKDNFCKSCSAQMAAQGAIIGNTTISESEQCIESYVSHDTNLDIASLLICVDVGAGKIKQFSYSKSSDESTFSFIRQQKKQGLGMMLYLNGELQVSVNPVANFTIMDLQVLALVLEYANQAARGLLQAKQMVNVTSQVNLYFMPHVDTMHGQWLKNMTQ